MFNHGVKISGKRPFLGSRINYKIGREGEVLKEYNWLTFEQVAELRTAIGSALINLITNEKLNTKVGILSVNRPEWVIADLALQAYSLVNVSLYDTLGPDAVEFILNHSEISVVFCSGDRIGNFIEISKKCPKLKYLISLESFEKSENQKTCEILKRWGRDRGIIILGWDEMLTLGRHDPLPHRPSKVDDIFSICYTSGTTGNPKGAIYVNKMPACAIKNFYESGIVLNEDVVHLSYLPLAHCYEKTFLALMCYYGARVGFNSGDVTRLAEDAQILKPTIFLGVPRVYNKMYDAIRANTIDAPGVKGMLARTAFSAKMDNLIENKTYIHSLWDRILFSKVAAILGGRVKYFVTGSAPVDHKVMQFFRVMFSCEFCEGYGSTESCAYGSVLSVGDFTSGHVGKPPSCAEVKLVAVPDMNYSVTGSIPKGELCFRGPFIFPGYYRDPEKTKEALDGEGWLHTGDIAAYNPETGKISIIDRKKNIFKLSQGEYVAPENLEIVYVNCSMIGQIFVHGDSLKNDLVAIIVPKEDFINSFFKQRNKSVNYADPELKELISKDIISVAKKYKLNGYEYIKAFYLEKDQFTIENDLLTPTFKLKRHQARLRYAAIIEDLYKEIESRESKSYGNNNIEKDDMISKL